MKMEPVDDKEVGWSDVLTPINYEWSAFDGRKLPEPEWRYGLYRRWEPGFKNGYYERGVLRILNLDNIV
jgi:hypothetical protein